MKRTDKRYGEYLSILREELVCAEGCTEPIAVAYAAARCRALLGEEVRSCLLRVSGPIIKNVKSVIVPRTGGRKGLDVALAIGILGGDPEAELEVLSGVTPEQTQQLPVFLSRCAMGITPADNDVPFYIDLTEYGDAHSARIVLMDTHTNVLLLERDGEAVWRQTAPTDHGHQTDRSGLSLAGIVDFAHTAELDDIRSVIENMLRCNEAIAQAGLRQPWGAQIGATLRSAWGESVLVRARAAAAAASDARMSGCELPVVIASGSGNQGITCSLPVLEYARALESGPERTIRAVTLSALTTVHIKTGIGAVSAFCGAVCAGVGAGCGIAYLQGADADTIERTAANALVICDGMVCDGAKPSCAAKISMAVEAGVLGWEMARRGRAFQPGDGLVKTGAEDTIRAVCEMGSDGMRQTDRKILEIMLRD